MKTNLEIAKETATAYIGQSERSLWCFVLDAIRQSDDQLLRECLVFNAGLGIPTPETGYHNDGGFGLFFSDLRRAIEEKNKKIENLQKSFQLSQEARRAWLVEFDRLATLAETKINEQSTI